MITFSEFPSTQMLEEDSCFQLLFNANPRPMWVFDRETLEFLAVNDAAVQKYGWSREEFLSMTVGEVRPQEDVALLEVYLSEQEGQDSCG
jgi:PAS domain S-box-containing protein